MIKRKERYFIPKGHTELKENDKLLIISDDDEALLQAYDLLGITSYTHQEKLNNLPLSSVCMEIQFKTPYIMFDTAHIHPMLVHFPIALALLGCLLESISLYRKWFFCLR